MVSKTIKGVKQNGEEMWYSPQELRISKLNAWKGWLCSVGQNNIAIAENGDMKGGDCGVGGYLGNIYNTFKIPTENDWHICSLNHCSCFFDIGVPKYTPSKKSEFISFEDPNTSLKFEWFLSAKCNYECQYCPDGYHNKLPHKNTSKNVITGLNNLFNYLDNKKFTMSFWGGEPTLFPNYINICKILNDYGSSVFTTTNGSRSDKYLKELIHHSCISISIHEKFYDQNRIIKNIL